MLFEIDFCNCVMEIRQHLRTPQTMININVLDIVLKCPSGENHYSSMALTRDNNNNIEGLLVNIKKRLFNNMIPFYADWMGTFLARVEKRLMYKPNIICFKKIQ